MLHVFGLKIAREPGAIVEVDCPHCRMRTRAQNERVVESVSLMHLIPLFDNQTARLKCLTCGTELVSVSAEAGLAHRSYAKDVRRYEQRVSPALKFAAIVSLLLIPIPWVGPMFSLTTAAFGWRNEGWPETITTVAVVLSTLVTLIIYPIVTGALK